MIDIAIIYLSPAAFRQDPQVGVRVVGTWGSLVETFTSPIFADDKRAGGAWCPTDLAQGIVKGGRGPVSLLCADVDDCGPGALDLSAKVLAPYAGVVFPTFNATPEKEKHRIVLLPSRAIKPDEFPLAWRKMATTLARSEISLDATCKNINRLYFAPAAPSPEAWLGARVLNGNPVDVDAMLAVAREEGEEERQLREAVAAARPPITSPDRYVQGALRRARVTILGAAEGGRHGALLREAYALARFDLSEAQIHDALLDAFVAVAGEPRRHEGERAIRDAVAARKRSA